MKPCEVKFPLPTLTDAEMTKVVDDVVASKVILDSFIPDYIFPMVGRSAFGVDHFPQEAQEFLEDSPPTNSDTFPLGAAMIYVDSVEEFLTGMIPVASPDSNCVFLNGPDNVRFRDALKARRDAAVGADATDEAKQEYYNTLTGQLRKNIEARRAALTAATA